MMQWSKTRWFVFIVVECGPLLAVFTAYAYAFNHFKWW